MLCMTVLCGQGDVGEQTGPSKVTSQSNKPVNNLVNVAKQCGLE